MAVAAAVVRGGTVIPRSVVTRPAPRASSREDLARARAVIEAQGAALLAAQQATALAMQQLQLVTTQATATQAALGATLATANGLNAQINTAHATHMREYNAAIATRTDDILGGAALGFCVGPAVCGLGVLIGAVSAPVACTAVVVAKIVCVSAATATAGGVLAASENTARADASLRAAQLLIVPPPALPPPPPPA